MSSAASSLPAARCTRTAVSMSSAASLMLSQRHELGGLGHQRVRVRRRPSIACGGGDGMSSFGHDCLGRIVRPPAGCRAAPASVSARRSAARAAERRLFDGSSASPAPAALDRLRRGQGRASLASAGGAREARMSGGAWPGVGLERRGLLGRLDAVGPRPGDVEDEGEPLVVVRGPGAHARAPRGRRLAIAGPPRRRGRSGAPARTPRPPPASGRADGGRCRGWRTAAAGPARVGCLAVGVEGLVEGCRARPCARAATPPCTGRTGARSRGRAYRVGRANGPRGRYCVRATAWCTAAPSGRA